MKAPKAERKRSDRIQAVLAVQNGQEVAMVPLNGRRVDRLERALRQYAYRHGWKLSIREVGDSLEIRRREAANG